MADIKVRFPLPDYTDPTRLPLITLVDQGDGTFAPKISGGGGGATTSGAPTDATYITKTANSTLSAEIAIGSGTAGQILTSDGTNPGWGNGPMTAQGDLIRGGTSGFPTRVSVGTSGQILQSDGTNPTWATVTDSTTPAAVATVGASGSAATLAKRDHAHAHEAAHIAHDTIWDAAGDLVQGSGADTATKLSIGAANKILTSDGTNATWGNGPMTTSGDLIYGGASGAPTRLSVGSSGKVLQSDGTNPSWQTPVSPGVVFLASQTASSSATLDFTSVITSTYDEYIIELLSVVPATDSTILECRISTNNGSTFDTASNYYNNNLYNAAGTNAWTAAGATATHIQLAHNVGNSGVLGVSGSVRFYPTGSNQRWFVGQTAYLPSGANRATNLVNSDYELGTFNAVRFLFSSGNIASGIIRIYGVAKA